MEPYAQIPDAGPFAASVNLFTALVAELEGPVAAGLTACELEDLLAERGREVERQLLQDHLDLRAAREEQAVRERRVPAVGADGITRNRVEAGHHRLLATLFGTVQVTRCAWRRPGHRACARLMRPCRGRPAGRPMPWPGWPRWRRRAARSRPRTRPSPAAAGR
jgi:hypothetical protein